ncbi:MAG: hypothetical protein R3Y13_00515 [bacterium]
MKINKGRKFNNLIKICTEISKLISAAILIIMIKEELEEERVYEEYITAQGVEFLIKKNEQLTAEEIMFFYKSNIILLEHENLIDIEQLKKFLSNVSIEYNLEEDGISGTYNRKTDLIKVEEDEFIETKKSVLLHEILHGYTSSSNNTSVYLNELLNELCTVEYCEVLDIEYFNSGYTKHLVIIYVLANIIEIETLQELKFSADLTNFKNELLSFGVTEKEYESFLNNLNGLWLSRTKGEVFRTGLYIEMYDLLSSFYKKKYNKDIEYDIEIMLIMYDSVLSNETVEKAVKKYLDYDENYENSGFYNNTYELKVINEGLYSKDLIEKKEETSYVHKEEEKEIDYNYLPTYEDVMFTDQFKEKISKNINLSFREQQLIYNTIYFLNDYREYVDEEEILKFADNLNFIYIKDMEGKATYNSKNYTLILDENIAGIQVIYEILKTYTNNIEEINEYIYDISNNIFHLEYLVRSMGAFTYNYFTTDFMIVEFLVNLLGEEFFLNYKFNPSDEYIYISLSNLGLNNQEITELLKILEELNSLRGNEELELSVIKKMYPYIESILKKPKTEGREYLISVVLDFEENLNHYYMYDEENDSLTKTKNNRFFYTTFLREYVIGDRRMIKVRENSNNR